MSAHGPLGGLPDRVQCLQQSLQLHARAPTQQSANLSALCLDEHGAAQMGIICGLLLSMRWCAQRRFDRDSRGQSSEDCGRDAGSKGTDLQST